MSTLTLLIDEAFDPQRPVEWSLREARRGIAQTGTGRLDQMPRADDVELILPASRVTLLKTKLPGSGAANKPAVLRYAIEDQVMADPDSLGVAKLGSDDDSIGVAVFDREWLNVVLDACKAANLRVRAAYAETLLAPMPETGWSVVLNEGHGVLRQRKYAGLSFDGATAVSPPVAIKLACDEARRQGSLPGTLVIYTCEGTAEPDLAAWQESLQVRVESGGAWSALHAATDNDNGINLLQFEFAPSSFRSEWLPRLRPAAYLGAAILVLQLGANGLDWLMLRQEKTRLTESMNARYKATFPEARAVVDASRQMQTRLSGLRTAAGRSGPADLVPMIARVGAPLDRAVRVSVLDYSPGVLKLDLILPSASMAESIRAQLAQDGLSVELDDVTPLNRGASARYTIRAPI